MKNFKLLLATTAMLSMGAMAANAEQDYTAPFNVNASVNLVTPLRYQINETLHFGDVGTYGSELGNKTVILDPTDSDLSNIGGTAQYFGGAHLAAIETNQAVHVVLPSSVNMRMNDGTGEGTKPCGRVVPTSNADGGNTNDVIIIGGTFTMDFSSTYTIDDLQCSGDILVTLLTENQYNEMLAAAGD